MSSCGLDQWVTLLSEWAAASQRSRAVRGEPRPSHGTCLTRVAGEAAPVKTRRRASRTLLRLSEHLSRPVEKWATFAGLKVVHLRRHAGRRRQLKIDPPRRLEMHPLLASSPSRRLGLLGQRGAECADELSSASPAPRRISESRRFRRYLNFPQTSATCGKRSNLRYSRFRGIPVVGLSGDRRQNSDFQRLLMRYAWRCVCPDCRLPRRQYQRIAVLQASRRPRRGHHESLSQRRQAQRRTGLGR